MLVVEDDAQVRALAAQMLRELGYRCLVADSGREALQMLAEHPEVALLFTDVVMPDMNGRELWREASRLYPGLKVLFTSGYTQNAVVHNGIVDPGDGSHTILLNEKARPEGGPGFRDGRESLGSAQSQRRLIQLRRMASASWRRLLARCMSDSSSGRAVSSRMAPHAEESSWTSSPVQLKGVEIRELSLHDRRQRR